MKKYILIFISLAFCISSFAQVSMESADDGILITDSDDEVLFFQLETSTEDGSVTRNNFIPSLWSIDGKIMTGKTEGDQARPNGVFWAWPQVWVGGTPTGNPWENEDFDQNVVSVEYIRSRGGTGRLMTEVMWSSDQWLVNGQKSPYIKENTAITVFPEQSNYRRIEFEIELLALEGGVMMGAPEQGIGGFALGMNFPDDIQFFGTNGNINPNEEEPYSGEYINIFGSVGRNEREGGIIILAHPENSDRQPIWNIDRENGLVNPAFPGNRLVPVSSEEPLVLRYTLIVYSGMMRDRKLSRILSD